MSAEQVPILWNPLRSMSVGGMSTGETKKAPIRRPTIRDVAATAGVSKSLVSLVYSKPASVSEKRRQRVLDAADELGFRPNWVARSLATDNGHFVGILVADLHNPLFAEIVDAARIELARAGQFGFMTSAVLPRSGEEPQLDSRIIAAFSDLRPSGILVVGSVPGMASLSRLSYGVPIVVASAVADDLPSAMTVRVDDELGMRLVIDHLVGAGHRRIAHIGGEGGIVSAQRAQAYRAAMTAHGLKAEIWVHPSDYSEQAGYAATRSLLDSAARPTAITAVNDLAAIGALSAASDAGLTIPVNLAVTGYDNSFVSAIRGVSLTSVDPGNAEIGTQAAKWLSCPDNEKRSPGEVYLVRPSLVIRDSTGGGT